MAGLDITPVAGTGRQVIQSYGDDCFRISQILHQGAVIVLAEQVMAWEVPGEVDGIDAVSIDALAPVISRATEIDILLIGCGARFGLPPKGLRAALKEAGLVLEWMDTGAACRTFNVLVSEERRVAAALLPVA